MTLKDSINKIQNDLDLTKKGYKFNKSIFWLMMFCLIALFFWAWSSNGFSSEKSVYISCPADSGELCKNPLFGDCEEAYCQLEYIFPGYEYGKKPFWLVQYFDLVAVGVVVFFLLLNHFLYNRGFKFWFWTEDKL